MKNISSVFGFVLLAISVLAGCHEFGHDGGGGFGNSGNSLRGIVQRNDPRYSSFVFQTDDRRAVAFYHNAQTRVRYQNRDYPVQNIQAGDYIEIRARDITATTPTADTITVIRPVSGITGRIESFEGRVELINARGGTFEVRSANNRLIVVVMPKNPSPAVSRRFSRLRNGDGVHVEGRFVEQNRLELTNFQ